MRKEEKKLNNIIEKEKANALKISIKEGSATSFGNDLGNSLILPLATEIGANALHIGILNSFSGLASPLAQIKGDRLMEKYSRKKIVTKYVLYQALTWIPIAAIGLLYAKHIVQGYLPWVLIIIYTLLVNFGGLSHPAWFSWMGDIVPEKERGKYFAKRNVYIGIASTVALLFGGWFLKYSKSAGILFIGFGILFFLSFLFRLISSFYLKKQYAPQFRLRKRSYFSFLAFLKRYDNFGKFAVYQAFFNFAVMVASPFFALYMLKDLGFEKDYFLYMVVSLASTVFYLLFTPLAGKFSDKYGNLKLMWIANLTFAMTPVAWLFVKTPLAIIFIPQLISGIANAALSIAVTNYTYDSVSQEKRGLCVAYTNVLIGIGTFAGSLLGGFLIDKISLSWINPFIFVFIIAALLRLLVAIFFLPQLKEVKRVARLKLHVPIHLHLSNPLRSLHLENTVFGFNHHAHKNTRHKQNK